MRDFSTPDGSTDLVELRSKTWRSERRSGNISSYKQLARDTDSEGRERARHSATWWKMCAMRRGWFATTIHQNQTVICSKRDRRQGYRYMQGGMTSNLLYELLNKTRGEAREAGIWTPLVYCTEQVMWTTSPTASVSLMKSCWRSNAGATTSSLPK